ncbi:MAG: 4a-hydroxytetrahydrobiopterin dehydratase [DPANN group archaeon]|nr:4a-hydroxytetrahydrobiopterin dehydratase [DPANN group archaeon]
MTAGITGKLTDKKCVPCEGGIPPLTRKEFEPMLEQVPKWGVTQDEKSISKEFEFKNFKQAMFFINAVAYIAEQEGHHPDIHLHGWNKIKFELSTHAIKGLSDNDFILAAKIDHLL